MNYPQILREKPVLLLLVPALAAFFIALIPTLKYQWPLGGDIFYHVHLAKLYLEQGLVYWDPLTSAPYGRPIFIPLFFICYCFHWALSLGTFSLQPGVYNQY